MKKAIAILLCALMLVTVAACRKAPEKPAETPTAPVPDSETETVPAPDSDAEAEPLPVPVTESKEPTVPISGGWQVAESVEMTDGLRAIFDKALDGLLGVSYVPVACLGTQIVAGTNYCFLAQADGSPYFIYAYEDLEGNTSLVNFELFYMEAFV